jgi:molybdopterin-containing oxidoreductase family iron-sulfur binding subunit
MPPVPPPTGEPDAASAAPEENGLALSRRGFLKLAGLTGAGALAGCGVPPAERLLPHVLTPDDQRPGIATWYASTCRECSSGCGVLVRTREGRALKLEGNPAHPINRGTLCARGQASVQGLYNPDRVPGPRAKEGGKWVELTWAEAERRLTEKLGAAGPNEIQMWTGATGDSWDAFLATWAGAFGAQRVAYEPIEYTAERTAASRVFGTATVPVFDLGKARYVLSLGADFLDTWGLPLYQSHGYAAMHGGRGGVLGKHVQIEPRMSLTGHSADEWIGIVPGTEGVFVLGLAHALGFGVSLYDLDRAARECGVPADTFRRLAQEMRAEGPAVVLGPGAANAGTNATEVWTAVYALNRALGAVGTVVLPSPGFDPGRTTPYREARAAAQRLAEGGVQVLLVHEANPAYALPGFAEAATKAAFKVSFSPYWDETAALCDLVLPDHHWLESWGDVEPVGGVRGLVQPSMRPVFQTKQAGDVLLAAARARSGAAAAAFPDASYREYIVRRWGGDVAAFNERLRTGGDLPAALAGGGAGGGGMPSGLESAALIGEGDYTLVTYPHPFVHDGRGANKPWLAEIPDPVTKVYWDHWCEVSPAAAKSLGVAQGDALIVKTAAGQADLPVIVNPQMRDDVVAVPMGYGHTEYGRYAKDRGANAFALVPPAEDQSSGARAYLAAKATLSRSQTAHKLVWAGRDGDQKDREIARAIPLTQVRAHADGEPATSHGHAYEPLATDPEAMRRGPQGGPEGTAPALTFPTFRDRTDQLNGFRAEPRTAEQLPPTGSQQYNRAKHWWGMGIDLSACTGCSACVAACNAENNIPWIGKTNLERGRDMQWLRLERYYEPVEGGIETRFVPMLCQHCGNAPCETVCPVYATYHNPEGLNVQVYNRCVGTRYCANNCPYRVRSFNWFDYNCWAAPLNMQLNPDVTVRSKGVMEKCTFCVQRIAAGKDLARDEGRDVRDGDITPACAQTCPTQAIVFGDLTDPESRVSQWSRDARRYRVLEDLNTQPSVRYLSKVSRRTPLRDGDPAHAGGEA